ncbi:MAG TPA: ABC transporter permease [Acidimicrobiia bacterium]
MSTSVRRILGPVVPLLLILGVVVLQHLAGPQHGQPGYTGFVTSPGVMLQGADRGLIIALLAVGMTLIYRTNNIINFAQSEMGFAAATLASLLILDTGWNYYLAVIVGLLTAIVVGLTIEFVFIRRFRNSPRLILTVATTGIQQLLVSAALGLNVAFGTGSATFFKPPISTSFGVGSTNFAGDDVLIIIVAPIVLIALAFFLRFGSFGKAIRASAERSDRASLLGIPVRRIHSMVWIISAVLSYIAMMLYIGNAGLPRGYPLGAEILLMTLAAAVIGRFDHMPTIVLTSIGMGILNASIRYEWPDPSQRDFGIALVAIVAVLVVRQTRGTRAGMVSSWQDSREVRPIPHELRNVPEVKWTRIGLMVALGAFVIAIPFWFSDSKLILATSIVIYSIVAVSLVVLTGWAGQVSLGHLALVAFGGAAAGTMTTRYHWDLSLALVMAAAVSVVMLLLVGLPAIRAGGLALGITTLALMLAAPYLLTANLAPWFLKSKLPLFEADATRFRPHLFGRITLDSDVRYYFFCLVMLAAAILAAKGLRRARAGRVLIGLRENERNAQAFGIGSWSAYITALVVSGIMAGVAGGLTVTQSRNFFILNEFNFYQGLAIFTIVVLGGLGSIGGGIAGAVFILGINYFVPASAEWAKFLASGLGELLVLMLLPGGLGAAAGDLRDAGLRWVARRRNIRVPSLLADTLVVETVVGADAPEAMAQAEAVGVQP